jgi:transposase
MASLQKQHGKYWVIVKSERINGKPTPKVLAYLGTADDMLAKLGGKKPVSSISYEYGTVAVMDKFIRKMGISELFNQKMFDASTSVPKRNNLTFGEVMSLIVIQRALQPDSKRAFGKWSKRTFLPQIYNFEPDKITSQSLWDMMNHADISKLKDVELEITKGIIKDYKIVLDLVLYDYTNFFTFIDTLNDSSPIAKRGKNKQKRDDLRQFSLALLVARGLRIPIFSDIYEGNTSDSNEFKNTIGKITNRLTELSGSLEKVTLVFDKGSNSKDNFDKMGSLNYVASLSLSHDKELKNISYVKFYTLEKKNINGEIEKIKCYRLKKDIWGTERTVLIYKSENLYAGQLLGIEKDIIKTDEELVGLKKRIKSGYYFEGGEKKKWIPELIEKEIRKILNKQFVRDVYDFSVDGSKHGVLDFTASINLGNLDVLKKTVLGKRILITSRHGWKDEEIIDAYHGQSDVEQSFRQIKNPFHNCVRPQYHWTDQKIIVHTFCSVLSYTISCCIEKVAKDNGFKMSINEIFDRLADIRKAKYLYQGKNKKKKEYEVDFKIEEIEDEETKMLFNILMK